MSKGRSLAPAVKIPYEIQFTVPFFQFRVAQTFASLHISIGFHYDTQAAGGIFRILWKFTPVPTLQRPPQPQPQPQRHHPRGKTSTTPAFEVNPERFTVPTQPIPSTSSAPSTSTSVPQQSSTGRLRPAVFQFGKSKQQDFRFDSLQRKGQLQLLGVYYEDEEELRGLYWTKDRTKLSEEEVKDLKEQLSNQPFDEAIDED